MEIRQLDQLIPGTEFDADIIIVGAGPAGLTMAKEFAGTTTRVTLVECGLADPDPKLDVLNAFDAAGPREILEQLLIRYRSVGGNTQLWMGKVAAFDEVDYARRDWVPGSGWPIDPTEIGAYLDRAARVLNLGPNVYDERLWKLLKVASPIASLDAPLIRSVFWQFSKSRQSALEVMRFGDEARSISAPNVCALLGATVTHVNTNDNGTRFESVEVRSLLGARAILRARAVVLCAGGIENPRILLASNRIVPHGLGNQTDQVGRHLMTHLRCRLGVFEQSDFARVRRMFGFFLLRSGSIHYPYQHGFSLTPPVQRSEGLLNGAAFVTEQRSPKDPWDNMKRLLRRESSRPLVDASTILAQPVSLASGAYRRFVQKRGVLHRVDRLMLEAFIEQNPEPHHRITLSDRTDPFDIAVPRVAWRVSEKERRTAIRLGQVIAKEFERKDLPRIALADWVRKGDVSAAVFETVAHPTGTTRMSETPRNGVVDRDCRLHGVQGVYVAGSSVFPTAGHANPTLMIVAFAIRLADRLKREFTNRSRS